MADFEGERWRYVRRLTSFVPPRKPVMNTRGTRAFEWNFIGCDLPRPFAKVSYVPANPAVSARVNVIFERRPHYRAGSWARGAPCLKIDRAICSFDSDNPNCFNAQRRETILNFYREGGGVSVATNQILNPEYTGWENAACLAGWWIIIGRLADGLGLRLISVHF